MKQTSVDKQLIKFLLLEGVHDSAEALIRAAGYHNIEREKGSLEGQALLDRVRDVHFLGIRSRTQLTAEVFDAAAKLNAVGCFCIGTNQVDLSAALERGIAVFNAPFSNTRSVAELVLGQAILLLRGVPAKNAAAHRGQWLKTANNSYELRGKTLGIVGYGSIGSQLSVMAESLGMRVIFYDVVTKLPHGNARQVLTLKELLQESHVVTLHVPETIETRWMMGSTQLAQMRDKSVLINASRGTVVEISALKHAIDSGKLLGAALDVFPIEPASNQDAFDSELRGLDNVILTPHIGGSTVEAQESIGREVAEKLVKYSDNGTSVSSVNFPEVALPAHAGKHRILHIHHNVPGILSAINQIFSDTGVNISAQYLQTRGSVGYVVMDTDIEQSVEALGRLREVPGTIRTRILF
ncbi:phosphoglycerate dehydrogenase [Orrella daihaiensis]|uniref:D-3-phosphoglycerate dehydrogenase n=1 Tax=Orrella daihaiensis TaxID=2782176 RepID=A0ABY4AK50_9BURK|nr:phosphoglycerate dehydrogenase [Orrella daihaiensis]UOD49775.1 phosphoglycerate dehydrogenase [Orrella daihaiensis]